MRKIIKEICGKPEWYPDASEIYESWKEKYPEYADAWIAQDKLKTLVKPKILQAKIDGETYAVIAKKLGIEPHQAQKIGKPLFDHYKRICAENHKKMCEAAGDTRTKQAQEDYTYITDMRTIELELNVLVPRIEEIEGLYKQND